MTPLGHVSLSFISGSYLFRTSRKNAGLFAFILGGAAPDLDFLFLMFDWFNNAHRVISHNLLFITVVAFAGAVFAGEEKRKPVVLGLFAGGLLHLAIDSCLDNNPTNGIGIALFWPFLDRLYSPVNLLSANSAGIGWDQPLKMVKLMMPLVLFEVPLYVLATVILFRRVRGNQKSYTDSPAHPL